MESSGDLEERACVQLEGALHGLHEECELWEARCVELQQRLAEARADGVPADPPQLRSEAEQRALGEGVAAELGERAALRAQAECVQALVAWGHAMEDGWRDLEARVADGPVRRLRAAAARVARCQHSAVAAYAHAVEDVQTLLDRGAVPSETLKGWATAGDAAAARQARTREEERAQQKAMLQALNVMCSRST